MIILVVSGMTLRTDEFSQAFQKVYFNVYMQVLNFGVVSAIVFGVTRFLVNTVHILHETLADGMVVCSCLPMAINIVIVLTSSGNGDEASAVFHTTLSNIAGIFLSPTLILGYLGSKSDIDLPTVFLNLTLKAIVPLAVGQILQKASPAVVQFCKRNKAHFKKLQESCLVFIIYIVFCRTFSAQGDKERTIGFGEFFVMIVLQFLFLLFFFALAWFSLGLFFPNQPKLRVMGVFGCPAKTIALGIPLINSMYDGNPNLALYALPLLVWHPTQLIVGTLLAPRLAAYVQVETKRLEQEKIDMADETRKQQDEAKDTVVQPAGTDLEAASDDKQ
jgi:solute carrier family 10 (sodium/bile acid cotransporter), member 7